MNPLSQCQVKIGVDIVSVLRFENLSKSTLFLHRCFTPNEFEYCCSMPFPPQHFAARFAGKEAVIKAISGLGLTLNMNNIEITNDEIGRPMVTYLTKDPKFQNLRTDISLSHSDSSAVAFAIVYTTDE